MRYSSIHSLTHSCILHNQSVHDTDNTFRECKLYYSLDSKEQKKKTTRTHTHTKQENQMQLKDKQKNYVSNRKSARIKAIYVHISSAGLRSRSRSRTFTYTIFYATIKMMLKLKPNEAHRIIKIIKIAKLL